MGFSEPDIFWCLKAGRRAGGQSDADVLTYGGRREEAAAVHLRERKATLRGRVERGLSEDL